MGVPGALAASFLSVDTEREMEKTQMQRQRKPRGIFI